MKTDYVIIALQNYREVMESVKTFLAKGWECQGGISISHNAVGDIMYAQAMTKTTKE